MNYIIKEEGGFRYIDEGQGQTLLLLHGLFGALSNWADVIEEFRQDYRIVIPIMPLYEMPAKEAGIESLTDIIEKFVVLKNLSNLTLLGNSLGGHVALAYTLRQQQNVKKLVLTGSSGLFENQMGGSYPKRGSYEYVADRVAYTFYDPKVATKELIDEVFDITTNSQKALNTVYIARSAQRNNMADSLGQITVPTCLIWGLNDTITPPSVAHDFNRLMPNSELWFIDHCGHAPMMEQPLEFNRIVHQFLKK